MTYAKGVDVSYYQSTTPPLTGLSFLIARSSIGLGTDPRYSKHIANAKAAGLVTGAYHFAYTGRIADQADLFLRTAGDVDLLFIDVEGRGQPTQAEVRAFIKRVQAAGKRCGLYRSESVYYEAGQDYDWIANWSAMPSRSWDFHQYRGSPLDLDRFNGTDADLRAFAKVPTAPDSSVGDMGLRIKLDATLPDGDQYDDFGTAVLEKGAIRNVATGANVAVAAGTSLGLVQKGWFLGEAGGPAFDPPTAIYAFNNGNELHIVAATNCSFVPLAKPAPVDCSAQDAAIEKLKGQLAVLTSQVTSYESRLKTINGLSAV